MSAHQDSRPVRNPPRNSDSPNLGMSSTPPATMPGEMDFLSRAHPRRAPRLTEEGNAVTGPSNETGTTQAAAENRAESAQQGYRYSTNSPCWNCLSHSRYPCVFVATGIHDGKHVSSGGNGSAKSKQCRCCQQKGLLCVKLPGAFDHLLKRRFDDPLPWCDDNADARREIIEHISFVTTGARAWPLSVDSWYLHDGKNRGSQSGLRSSIGPEDGEGDQKAENKGEEEAVDEREKRAMEAHLEMLRETNRAYADEQFWDDIPDEAECDDYNYDARDEIEREGYFDDLLYSSDPDNDEEANSGDGEGSDPDDEEGWD